jgi:hypothetical protein
MKKHSVDGAYARAGALRQNITEAERRVWQIPRSHQMKPTNCAASPPPKPSPIEGSFCGLSLEPSPSMGEGWRG